MNEKTFGKDFYLSDSAERIEKIKNFPTVDADVSDEKTPLDAALIDEWPVEKHPAVDGNMEGTIVQEGPRDQTIIYKGLMGETVAHEVSTDGRVAAVEHQEEPVVSPSSTNSILPPEESDITSTGLPAPLLDRNESEFFRTRWNDIQARFVDEPYVAVQQADDLVKEVIVQISQVLENGHSLLDGQWKQSPQISTEDLRKALHSYRFFFNRLMI
jgi:hypothetical protein